jgi:hypothetical protein
MLVAGGVDAVQEPDLAAVTGPCHHHDPPPPPPEKPPPEKPLSDPPPEKPLSDPPPRKPFWLSPAVRDPAVGAGGEVVYG